VEKIHTVTDRVAVSYGYPKETVVAEKFHAIVALWVRL
jgi:hypothetical protein